MAFTSSFHVPLVPSNLARPPVLWTSTEVKAWVDFCIQEFSLPQIYLDKFNINGKALLLLNRADFIERAPEGGDVLYNAFKLLARANGSSLTYHFQSTHTHAHTKTPLTSPTLPAPGIVPASVLSPATTDKYSSDSDSCPNDVANSPHSIESSNADLQPTCEESSHNTTSVPLQANVNEHKEEPAGAVAGTEVRLLWEFIYQLLLDEKHHDLVYWESKSELIFRINNPTGLADHWGLQKHRTNMTYEKLSRALRYYYKMSIIRKVAGKKLTYQYFQHPRLILRGHRGARPHSQRESTGDKASNQSLTTRDEASTLSSSSLTPAIGSPNDANQCLAISSAGTLPSSIVNAPSSSEHFHPNYSDLHHQNLQHHLSSDDVSVHCTMDTENALASQADILPHIMKSEQYIPTEINSTGEMDNTKHAMPQRKTCQQLDQDNSDQNAIKTRQLKVEIDSECYLSHPTSVSLPSTSSSPDCLNRAYRPSGQKGRSYSCPLSNPISPKMRGSQKGRSYSCPLSNSISPKMRGSIRKLSYQSGDLLIGTGELDQPLSTSFLSDLESPTFTLSQISDQEFTFGEISQLNEVSKRNGLVDVPSGSHSQFAESYPLDYAMPAHATHTPATSAQINSPQKTAVKMACAVDETMRIAHPLSVTPDSKCLNSNSSLLEKSSSPEPSYHTLREILSRNVSDRCYSLDKESSKHDSSNIIHPIGIPTTPSLQCSSNVTCANTCIRQSPSPSFEGFGQNLSLERCISVDSGTSSFSSDIHGNQIQTARSSAFSTNIKSPHSLPDAYITVCNNSGRVESYVNKTIPSLKIKRTFNHLTNSNTQRPPPAHLYMPYPVRHSAISSNEPEHWRYQCHEIKPEDKCMYECSFHQGSQLEDENILFAPPHAYQHPSRHSLSQASKTDSSQVISSHEKYPYHLASHSQSATFNASSSHGNANINHCIKYGSTNSNTNTNHYIKYGSGNDNKNANHSFEYGRSNSNTNINHPIEYDSSNINKINHPIVYDSSNSNNANHPIEYGSTNSNTNNNHPIVYDSSSSNSNKITNRPIEYGSTNSNTNNNHPIEYGSTNNSKITNHPIEYGNSNMNANRPIVYGSTNNNKITNRPIEYAQFCSDSARPTIPQVSGFKCKCQASANIAPVNYQHTNNCCSTIADDSVLTTSYRIQSEQEQPEDLSVKLS